jgi:hypothetical protein
MSKQPKDKAGLIKANASAPVSGGLARVTSNSARNTALRGYLGPRRPGGAKRPR